MKRTIDFYKILPTYSNQKSMFKTNERPDKDYFRDSIKTFCEVLLNDKSKLPKELSYFVEVMSVDSESIFAIIGKSSTMDKSTMQRLRNKKTLEEIQSDELLLDVFRFFVIDLNTLLIASITNSKVHNFPKNLERFFGIAIPENDEKPEYVDVIPFRDNEFSSKLNRMKTVKRLSMSFAELAPNTQQYLSLSELSKLSYHSAIKANVEISFTEEVTDLNDKNELQNKVNLGNFEKYELRGMDDEGNDLTLELIQKLLTKSIEIEISNEDFFEERVDAIKKKLLEELRKIHLD